VHSRIRALAALLPQHPLIWQATRLAARGDQPLAGAWRLPRPGGGSGRRAGPACAAAGFVRQPSLIAV